MMDRQEVNNPPPHFNALRNTRCTRTFTTTTEDCFSEKVKSEEADKQYEEAVEEALYQLARHCQCLKNFDDALQHLSLEGYKCRWKQCCRIQKRGIHC